jgi:microcystin degradation protein MlrC
VFAYGRNAAATEDVVNQIAHEVIARESQFALETFSIEQALQQIALTPSRERQPIVLADTQDNPGGGGTASTTSLLKALIAASHSRVLAGVIYDPASALRAHDAGKGAFVDLALGARFDEGANVAGETPIIGRFEVMSLGDGVFTGTGPFYCGARMNLGPMALLRTGSVYIVVSSRKQQAADQAMFRHVGAEPREFAVLALKSSVHFRADFGPMAQRILVVTAPGPNIANPAELPFTKLRTGVRAGITL